MAGMDGAFSVDTLGRRSDREPSPWERRSARRRLAEEVHAGYRPSLPGSGFWDPTSATPNLALMLRDVEAMLCHPRVEISLSMYMSGIAGAEFEVEDAGSPEQAEFALSELARFWSRCRAVVQLPSYAYGRGAFECTYADEDGLLRLERVEAFLPLDARVLTTRRGDYLGVRVFGVKGQSRDLDGPRGWRPAKAFWHAHRRRYDRWYGWPRLYPAWRPWRRLAGRDGAEDVVDGGVYRFAFQPPLGRYPPEDQFANALTGVEGRYETNRDRMREMLENLKAGGVVALSSRRDEQGNYAWDVDWPEGTLDVTGLLEYTGSLERAITLGIGVPPELLEASETGSGYSGRAIPMEAFTASMQENAEELLESWHWQVGAPLLRWNFGPGAFARLRAKDMAKARKEEAQRRQQGRQPGENGAPRQPGGPPRRGERFATAGGASPQEGDEAALRARLIARVLYGLYGWQAARLLRGGDRFAAWDESLHPRDPRTGRFVRRGSAAAVARAKEHVGRAVRGEATSAHAKELASSLALLAVAQLREVAAGRGRRVPKLLKAELVDAVMALLKEEGAPGGGAAAPPALDPAGVYARAGAATDEEFAAALAAVEAMGKAELQALVPKLGMVADPRWSAADLRGRVKQQFQARRATAVRAELAPESEQGRAKAARQQQTIEKGDPAEGRPSRPEERHTNADGTPILPAALPWRSPPPKAPRAAGEAFARPRGDDSQTRIGDLGEELALALGFRSILPVGQRSHRPGEVAEKGSTIDLEFDHSGNAYELKLCNTTATEYRLKAERSEKDAKLAFAERHQLTPYVLVGVRDVATGEVHFYAGREAGLSGAEVNEGKFDYVGSVKP